MTRAAPGVSRQKLPWSWHPDLPIGFAPVFEWPPRPLAALRYLLGRGFLLSTNFAFVVLAVLTWLYLAPSLERCAVFAPGWVARIFAVNLAAVVLTAGGLHLYFYTFRRQGAARKLDPANLATGDRRFFTGDQVRDNVFWSCASGVTVCSAYQAVFMWAYANGLLPWLEWSSNPVWFALLFVALYFWGTFHFYLIHRLLHWRPLYRIAHAVHHRNVNVGPWSGLSMHPIEHLLYFSTLLIHLVVASHPVHLIFQVYYKLLSAITSHSGYATVLVNGRPTLPLGDFYHQLHHRYFDCNYGGFDTPWDRWFGFFHDGTPEATARLRERQLRLRGSGRPPGVKR